MILLKDRWGSGSNNGKFSIHFGFSALTLAGVARWHPNLARLLRLCMQGLLCSDDLMGDTLFRHSSTQRNWVHINRAFYGNTSFVSSKLALHGAQSNWSSQNCIKTTCETHKTNSEKCLQNKWSLPLLSEDDLTRQEPLRSVDSLADIVLVTRTV